MMTGWKTGQLGDTETRGKWILLRFSPPLFLVSGPIFSKARKGEMSS